MEGPDPPPDVVSPIDEGSTVAVPAANPTASDPVATGENFQSKNRKFWAQKTALSLNRDNGVHVEFFPMEQRTDIVKLPLEVWENATGKYEKALVGFVFGSKPFLGKIKGFVRSRWGDETVVKVQAMKNGIFLFNFANTKKKMEVLLGGPWSFDNRPLILQEWSQHESYKCGSVASLPVWIRLPEIRAHLTDVTILGYLCSRIGKPICTDGVTADGSRLSYARVCVEIFADMDFIDEIEYEDPYGNKYRQEVFYEWRPPRCSNCLNFGHMKDKCPEESLETLIDVMKKHEEQQRRREISSLLVTSDETHELVPIIADNMETDLEPGEIPRNDPPVLGLISTPDPLSVSTRILSVVPDSQPGCSAAHDARMVASKSQPSCNALLTIVSESQTVPAAHAMLPQLPTVTSAGNDTISENTPLGVEFKKVLSKSSQKKARKIERDKFKAHGAKNAFDALTKEQNTRRNANGGQGARTKTIN